MISPFLYNVFVQIYALFVRLLQPFNPKAKKWIEGRVNWKQSLEDQLSATKIKGEKVIWLHAASVGEFEQGKPVLEGLKSFLPDYRVVVSFFSPSGYEAATGNNLSDHIFYLPLDTPSNARALVEILNPSLVLWMKYEYWWHHLTAIQKRGIPLLLVSAIFQKRQPFFKWYGGWHRKKLQVFSHIFVQNELSKELISPFFPKENITVSGDTRFDRVKKIETIWTPIPKIQEWIGNTEWVIVAGSTWPDDEKLLRHFIRSHKEVKWIIAPHHLDQKSLKETLAILPEALKYSDLVKNDNIENTHSNLLLIDSMGVLSRLYKYGKICFIGGGFTPTGIHNSLEASVYGRPLIFGPEYERYAEALGLVNGGAAISVANVLELEREILSLMKDPEKYKRSARVAYEFTERNTGATKKVVDYVLQKSPAH
ncbi:MAG: 3-deoxy-D-manno-octulosonic acid transferase [Chitinophagaceae bacterium]|nr:3-deoxy-D-manno-octulosonic acid transferase [Chitinophagaceae bacterium]